MQRRGRKPSPEQLPLVIGAGVLVLGLAIGIWPRGGNAPPPPAASASAAPGASTPPDSSAEPSLAEDYAPDLSGPDVGELLVAGASMAHGLAIVGDRLVWLLTDAATVGSARKDGGDASVVFTSADPEAFGGSMTSSPAAVWWSVDGEGDAPEPIYRAVAAELAAPLGQPAPIAKGTSPDHLVVSGDTLVWSDLGRLARLSGTETKTLATRDRRIVSVAAAGDAVFWLEAPYEGAGEHRLMKAATAGGEPTVLATLDAAERDMLIVAGEALFFSESRKGTEILWALDRGAKSPRRVARTGIVTAVAHDGSHLFWAEAHGDEEAPTSLLRALPIVGEAPPRRIGRVSGHVTALTVDAAHLYWSSPRGIERHPREP